MALKINPLLLTTSLATVYTCPVGTEGSIHGLVFSNTGASDVTITLTFYDASAATTYTLANGYVVKAESTFAWLRPINVNAGDYIQASASAGAVVLVHASVYEGTTTAVGFTVQGAWVSTTPYTTNDVVSYLGSSYAAIQPSTNQNPSTATAYWSLLASKGDTGAAGTNGTNGTAATVSVGTTTTGAAGTSASVTNSGTSSAAVLNFTIPRGDTGATGPIGPKSITVGSPSNAESITLFYTPTALTISSVYAAVTGTGTPSVTFSINSATARNSGTPTLNVSSQTTTSLTGASVTVANSSIAAGSWVWLTTSGTVGTTTNSVNVTLNF